MNNKSTLIMLVIMLVCVLAVYLFGPIAAVSGKAAAAAATRSSGASSCYETQGPETLQRCMLGATK